MPDFILSPNMNLPVPVVGQDPGPDWANNINSSLLLIDQHTHQPGFGAPITADSLNINSDLPMNNYNLTLTRSVRFQAQGSPLALPADVGCAYVSGVDLYFNDVSGNVIRLTQGGSVAGTPGSISGLVSPASASYVGFSQTFVWQSGVNTPANMDNGPVTIREVSPGAFGVTLEPASALGADYTLTLPTLPVSTKIMALSASGVMSAPYDVDNSTIEISSNTIQVKNGGITLAKMAANSVDTTQIVNAAVTNPKLATDAVSTPKIQDGAVTQVKITSNIVEGTSSGAVFTTASTTPVDVPNLNASITVSAGKNVRVLLESDSSPGGYIRGADGAGLIDAYVAINRDGTIISYSSINVQTAAAAPVAIQSALSSVSYLDTNPGAGAHTYKIQLFVNTSGSGTGTVAISQGMLVLEEC